MSENPSSSNDYPLCKCGKPSTIYASSLTLDLYYCDDCDPDPKLDEGDICYSCGEPSHRSQYIGAGIELGVCEKCDTGENLGFEHLCG